MNPDVPHHERLYVRNRRTSERGWLVTGSSGEQLVRLDGSPANPEFRAWSEKEWDKDHVEQPLTRMQVAMIAFEADKGLCGVSGLHEQSRKDWRALSQDERLAWMRLGPQKPMTAINMRKRLYQAIMDGMKEVSR